MYIFFINYNIKFVIKFESIYRPLNLNFNEIKIKFVIFLIYLNQKKLFKLFNLKPIMINLKLLKLIHLTALITTQTRLWKIRISVIISEFKIYYLYTIF